MLEGDESCKHIKLRDVKAITIEQLQRYIYAKPDIRSKILRELEDKSGESRHYVEVRNAEWEKVNGVYNKRSDDM